MKPAHWIAPFCLAALSRRSAAPAGRPAGRTVRQLDRLARPRRARRRTWTLHEFTTIRLVPRESGSAPNQHPAPIDAEVLRQQLAQVRFDAAPTSREALFAAGELAELVEPLREAFASAGPEDDVLLLSSSRRGGGMFLQPLAVTARLFVQGGQPAGDRQRRALRVLQRLQRLAAGRRSSPSVRATSAGTVALRSASATASRADWLALPLAGRGRRAGDRRAAGGSCASARGAAARRGGPARAAAPALRPRDPGFADEVEQRLITLKRLRERGLISEEEYQQKRREILQAL